MSRFFYTRNGKEHGPCGATELVALARQGAIGPDDLVRKDGGDFIRASKVRGLVFGPSSAIGAFPPPLPPHPVPSTPTSHPRAALASQPAMSRHCDSCGKQLPDRSLQGGFTTCQKCRDAKSRGPVVPAVAARSAGDEVVGFVILGVIGIGMFWISGWILSFVGCGRSAGSMTSRSPQAQVAPDGMTASKIITHLVQQHAAAIAGEITASCQVAAGGHSSAELAVPLQSTVQARTVELMTKEYRQALSSFGEDLSGVPFETVNAAIFKANKEVVFRLHNEFVNPVLFKKVGPR